MGPLTKENDTIGSERISFVARLTSSPISQFPDRVCCLAFGALTICTAEIPAAFTALAGPAGAKEMIETRALWRELPAPFCGRAAL
jgi:hypothetical protein